MLPSASRRQAAGVRGVHLLAGRVLLPHPASPHAMDKVLLLSQRGGIGAAAPTWLPCPNPAFRLFQAHSDQKSARTISTPIPMALSALQISAPTFLSQNCWIYY